MVFKAFPLETFIPLLKRSVTGPGEITANGVGAERAKLRVAIKKKSAGLERYLGIGCGVIAETVLK